MGVSELGRDFFEARIGSAARLRERLLPGETSYRLVHGESDLLPGLIVDRFGDSIVVQTLSCAMDRAVDVLTTVLDERFHPAAILERNDSDLRRLEGLPQKRGVICGKYTAPSEIVENGIRYRADLLAGQKTGFFLDQKWNRKAAAGYCSGQRVLDCFCNQGGFALAAARAGADSVVAVDSSSEAIAAVRENARLNGLRVDGVEADVFRYLQGAIDGGARFDVVILDPPSFAPRKKDVGRARKAYQRVNELALKVLNPAGFLVTASCSFHLREDVFFQVIRHAAARSGRTLQLLERRGQGPDHPVNPAMPETAYLKLAIFRVF